MANRFQAAPDITGYGYTVMDRDTEVPVAIPGGAGRYRFRRESDARAMALRLEGVLGQRGYALSPGMEGREGTGENPLSVSSPASGKGALARDLANLTYTVGYAAGREDQHHQGNEHSPAATWPLLKPELAQYGRITPAEQAKVKLSLAQGYRDGKRGDASRVTGEDADSYLSTWERLKLNPFAGYRDFADCERQHRDKRSPGAYCATIERRAGVWGRREGQESERGENPYRGITLHFQRGGDARLFVSYLRKAGYQVDDPVKAPGGGYGVYRRETSWSVSFHGSEGAAAVVQAFLYRDGRITTGSRNQDFDWLSRQYPEDYQRIAPLFEEGERENPRLSFTGPLGSPEQPLYSRSRRDLRYYRDAEGVWHESYLPFGKYQSWSRWRPTANEPSISDLLPPEGAGRWGSTREYPFLVFAFSVGNSGKITGVEGEWGYDNRADAEEQFDSLTLREGGGENVAAALVVDGKIVKGARSMGRGVDTTVQRYNKNYVRRLLERRSA